jgi:hypothetical protein
MAAIPFRSPQNKRRKGNLIRCTFLLSFDLRDYPSKTWDFSPSVSNPYDWIFPGFNQVTVLLPESFVPIFSGFAPSAPLLIRGLSCNSKKFCTNYEAMSRRI